jgi:hypothetical protein
MCRYRRIVDISDVDICDVDCMIFFSETEWHAEPGVPQIAPISDSSMESSSSEDTTDSLSSDSVNQRSIIEIDEPLLPVRPLFSRISFKVSLMMCVYNFNFFDFAESRTAMR